MQDTLEQFMTLQHIQTRVILFNENEDRMGAPPEWMTLQPDKGLVHLRPLLDEHFDLDDRARQALVDLIASGYCGMHEALRIIYHMMKDSDDQHWRSGPSGYLVKAVEEAQQALAAWQDWDCDARRSSSSSGAWGNYRPSGGGDAPPSRGFR